MVTRRLGVIVNGRYTKDSAPETKIASQYKSWSHDDQRFDHRSDLVQPYNRDGSVNQDFVEIYPKEAKETYGMIKEDTDG